MPQQTDPICAQCKQTSRRYFKVSYVDGNGVERGFASVCSLLCLVQWAQGAIVARGMQGIGMVKSAIDNVVKTVRGERK